MQYLFAIGWHPETKFFYPDGFIKNHEGQIIGEFDTKNAHNQKKWKLCID